MIKIPQKKIIKIGIVLLFSFVYAIVGISRYSKYPAVISDNALQTDRLASNSALLLVSRIIDGDTIEVENPTGKKEKVRLIGIDTPESVDPRKTVECYAVEASKKIQALIESKMVRLERDPSQNNTDTYGRLLRYVYRDDGLFINKLLIEEGYAFEYTYSTEYFYRNQFRSAEAYAREAKVGLWAPGVCSQ